MADADPLLKAKDLLATCVTDGEPQPLTIHTLNAYDLYGTLRWLISAHETHRNEIRDWQQRCESLKRKIAQMHGEREALAGFVRAINTAAQVIEEDPDDVDR